MLLSRPKLVTVKSGADIYTELKSPPKSFKAWPCKVPKFLGSKGHALQSYPQSLFIQILESQKCYCPATNDVPPLRWNCLL